ncbi:MAG: DUF2786 domain-containing protein [Deltaproteobacteria bacterium]|nr:DUF2786 domain-containing protein [Deltaproteobacteria bacterium]
MDFDQRMRDIRLRLRDNWAIELIRARQRLLDLVDWERDWPWSHVDIFDGSSCWGFFNQETRHIGINSELILKHPWEVALGVLGHEVAHELVSILSPKAARNEPPHGPSFQSFCERIRLHRVFRQAKIDLTENGPPPSPFGPQEANLKENPLLARIKKLLALSGSPEPREAEAALAKASELMTRHNIDAINDLGGPEEFELWRIPLPSNRLDRRTHLLANIIQNHFFAKVVFSHSYDAATNRPVRTFDLLGRPINLGMANHVFHYLTERTETLWDRHRPVAASLGEKGRGAKGAFIANLLSSLDQKLSLAARDLGRESPSRAGGRRPLTSDLILQRDEGLQRFADYNYVKLTRARGPSRLVRAPYSANAGRKAGEELDIYSPIGQDDGRGGAVSGYLGPGA